jgi:segregation and condensation protein B
MMAKKSGKTESKPKKTVKKKSAKSPAEVAPVEVVAEVPVEEAKPARKSRKKKNEPEAAPAEPAPETAPLDAVAEVPAEEAAPAKKSRGKKKAAEEPSAAETVEAPHEPATETHTAVTRAYEPVAEEPKPEKKSRKKKKSGGDSDNGTAAENTGDAPPDSHAETLAAGEVPVEDVAAEISEETGEPAAPPADLEELSRTIEALLFAAEEPIAPREIARASGSDSATVRKLLPAIKEAFAAQRKPWDITEVAGGYRMVTRPEFYPAIQRLKTQTAQRKLTQAALETLALIAYRQPIGRAEVESVRGVGAGPVLRILLEKKLIKISGRGTGLGQPLLYGTTDYFLEHFGLNTIADLPKPQEFKGA